MTAEQQPRTLFQKIWDAHVVMREGDQDLLWVDRHLVHEGSFHAFGKLDAAGRMVRHPELTFGMAGHYVPSDHSRAPSDPEVGNMIDLLSRNIRRQGIALFGLGDPRQGIVHVAAPEQGLTLPGLLVVCGDSHTATHSAFGAFAFGIGASEVAHVLATQTLWQIRPRMMRIRVDGQRSPMSSAKDLALHIIREIGTGGAKGHVVEYVGPVIDALSMEARMTLCNMTIESGARAGIIAPDDTTVAWLENRPYAPKGDAFAAARLFWSQLASDPQVRSYHRCPQARRRGGGRVTTRAFTVCEGTAALLPLANIDTDQLIPARFMRKLRGEGDGYGPYLLHDLRWHPDGQAVADFPLNRAATPPSFLVAGPNFGCGSSREGAVYALVDYGIRAVLAAGFGDIFRNNAVRNGLLPIELGGEDHDRLSHVVNAAPQAQLRIDLEAMSVVHPHLPAIGFSIDPACRRRLLLGLDDIAETSQHQTVIDAFAAAYRASGKWRWPRSADAAPELPAPGEAGT